MTHAGQGAQPDQPGRITGGVDTHRDTHHAAACDQHGRLLGTAEFPATAAGYEALLAWMCARGRLAGVGVEGTGSYGAGLTRFLTRHHVTVFEVNRPDRSQRRRRGKTDSLDAQAAARAVLAGDTTAVPKTHTGGVEALRMLHTARTGALKARTAALNTLHSMIVTADDPLRTQLRDLPKTHLPATCADLPDTSHDPADPTQATRTALRSLAGRITQLTREITGLNQQIDSLTQRLAPATTSVYGAGPATTAQLLITCGDNPDRLHNETALAALTGTSPLPASSGRTHRHRLNRGGDRQANKALHQIIIVRMRHDPRTRDYVRKRTQQGLSKKDIQRCLKRYLVREIYRTIRADLALDTQ